MRVLPLVPTLLVCTQLAAVEPDNPDVIEINAARLPVALEDLPYATYRLDQEELAFRNQRTLTDGMHNTPGIAMQKTAHNQASPFIRGLTGEQTLMLFDGVRYNHAMMRGGPNQYAAVVPQHAIGEINVVLGSASVVAGSDGLTGFMDFRLAEAGRDVVEGVGGYADARYGTAEDGGHLAAGIDGRSGGWAWSAEASTATYGDLTGGKDSDEHLFGDAADDDEIPNTAYGQYDVNARVRYDGAANQAFEAAVGHVEQDDTTRPDGYFENSGKTDRISRAYPLQAFTYLHLRHFWYPESESVREVTSTVWYHLHEEEQVRERIRDEGTPTERYRRRERDDAIDTIGVDVQIDQHIQQHEIVYGLTYFIDTADTSLEEFRSPAGDTNPDNATRRNLTDAEADAIATVPDGSEYTGLGIYAQDLWHLNNEWSLLYGLRYSRYDWEADVTERDFDTDKLDNSTDAITASVRASWTDQENWQAFTGISQGFRAPNLTNLTGAEGAGSTGTTFAGNPDLDPEQSVSFEAGMRYEFHDQHQSYVAANVYLTLIDDIIQRVFKDIDGDGTPDPVVENGKDAEIKGFEVHFDKAIESMPLLSQHGTFSVYSVTNFVDAENKVPLSDGSFTTTNISRASRFFGVIGAEYEHQSRWWGAAQVRWSDAYDDVAEGDPSDPSDGDAADVRLTVPGNDDGSLPGFAVLDLKAGWSNEDKSQSYQVMLENVFNKTYREIGSGNDSAGLNLVLSARLTF